jgi:DNA-binding LacI/PurR family transcriptional regulator
MAVTIQEVADRAGVSIGTVSRYLNGAQLRDYNRRKIAQAITELGFKANVAVIAALIAEPASIFTLSIIKAIERMVKDQEHNIIICDSDGDPHDLRERLLFFKNRAINGLILFPSTKTADSIDVLSEYQADGIPVVAVDEVIPGFETDAVVLDNARPSFWAMEHLIRANHTNIAILAGRPDSPVSQERLRGCTEALQTCNVPLEERWLKWGNSSTAGGYAAVKELFSSDPRPTALYTTNYEMTLGAIFALNELQLNVPQDVSLIGFDRFPETDLFKPALTVIEQPIEAIGRTTGELIMRRIAGDNAGFPQRVIHEPKMLVRDSVRKLEHRI